MIAEAGRMPIRSASSFESQAHSRMSAMDSQAAANCLGMELFSGQRKDGGFIGFHHRAQRFSLS